MKAHGAALATVLCIAIARCLLWAPTSNAQGGENSCRPMMSRDTADAFDYAKNVFDGEWQREYSRADTRFSIMFPAFTPCPSLAG